MLRMSGFAVGLALLISLPFMSPAPAPVNADFDGLKKHKVTICHFEDHDGPRGRGDFVTNNWVTLGNPVCDREGGTPIVVSAQGCNNGHDAYARYGRTCDEGANQAGAP